LINLTIVVAGALVIGIPRYLAPADRAGNRTKMVKSTFLIMAIAQGLVLCIGDSAYHIWVLPAMLVVCDLVGYWFANYRYSLLAPFVFYAILILGLLSVGSHYGWVSLNVSILNSAVFSAYAWKITPRSAHSEQKKVR
jgi:hypothetical protein